MALTNQTNTKQPIRVVHSTNIWLTQTMTWLYTLVKHQSNRIENHVVCNLTENLDQFPFERLTSETQDFSFWKYLSSKSWKVRKWRRSRLLNDRIQSCSAQVLHSHFGDQGWYNVSTASRIGLNHVVTFYGYDVGHLPKVEPVWRERYQEMFETANLFLCEGPHLGQCLVALGCPGEKVKVQHLGVSLEPIAFRPRVWHPGEHLRVLIAGTFLEKKGMPYAIEALGRIKKLVKLEITIIGDAIDQDRSRHEKFRILDAIDRHGLADHTQLRGYQPYSKMMEEAYRNHLFLSPSVSASDGDTEGGAPVTIIEMAASGMPVVSSFHCDIPEVITDGVTGLLAKEHDVDGLEKQLLWLLDNPGQWLEMTTAAREHIEREYSASTQGERLAAIYESLLV